MQQAVSDGVFPGGVLLVSVADAIMYFEAYGYANQFDGRLMTKDTVFDLASLTKPLATTLAVMQLVAQHKLELGQPLGAILPRLKDTDKSPITIEQLLYHNAGLPDYRPYYQTLAKLPRQQRRDALRDLLAAEPLIHPVGHEVLYSDLGFMILSWVIETVSGQRLDRLVTEEIYRPLGFKNLFFVDLDGKPSKANFAATEHCPWREILLEGAVHDDNAYVVGGIEGHAGLFGTAEDIYGLLSILLSVYNGRLTGHLFDKTLLRTFLKRREDTGRTLGFDTPALTGSSSGRYFSQESVGHLGFTGTSFWVDPVRRIMVILLTNRIHPSRDNNKIKAFRPKLHDVIMERIASKE